MNPEKLDLRSLDIAEDKKEKLKTLFPEVFNEKKIDFEKLKSALGEMIDAGKERYGMNWPGKADCMKIIQQPSIGTLKPCREESVDFNTTENLFIEGDNLEVLKLLQKSYYGKVKMIYIDPPYNTGNDFIYPDNYAENLDTYLKYTGQTDEEGRKYSTNAETDGRFHSKWLSMMYPRLFLARNLLQDDGVIFISIDDNEMDNLKKLCNEIFGEESFISTFVWKRRASSQLADKLVSSDHEYVLCYQREKFTKFEGKEKDYSGYSNPDNDPRGDYVLGDLTVGMTKDQRPNQYYTLKDPVSQKSYDPNPNRVWAYIKESMNVLLKENRIFFPKETTKRPMIKRYKNELKTNVNPISTWMTEVGQNAEGTRIIQNLFDIPVFNYSKPISLIDILIKNTLKENEVILDFFSGSCTTAHAVLELNKQDQINRKFICVQLPESCAEDTEAYRSGFKTIADIGKERIRRVIKKIKNEQTGQLELNKESKQDLGFKVFKLDRSNFKVWDSSQINQDEKELEKQLELHIDHVSKKSSEEDLLYELLLKSGLSLSLTTKIEKLNIHGKTVYSIAEGELLICLDKDLTKEAIKGIADKKPSMFICLDAGFHENDQLKTNAVQIMKSKEIEFRTV